MANSNNISGFAIKYILESGLILDEDFKAIFLHYTVDDNYFPSFHFSLPQKIMAGTSTAAAIILAFKECSIVTVSLSAAPVIMFGLYRVRNILYKKRQKRDIENLVGSLRDTLRLLRLILEYFKSKESLQSGFSDDGNSYTNPNRMLIDVIFREVKRFLYDFIKFVKHFGVKVPSLTEYEYLDNLEVEQFEPSRVGSIQHCVVYMKNLCDIYVLVTSNTLTCLAIMLCSRISHIHSVEPNKVLDSIVPEMKKSVIVCYEHVEKQFDDVKYYQFNRESVPKNRKPLFSGARGRLYVETTNVIAHTSEIIEKSQAIIKQLDKRDFESLPEKTILVEKLASLRKQVFDYYERLDLLYRMFEIDINQSKLPSEVKESSINESFEKSLDVQVETRPDDTFDLVEQWEDEEYEACVGANDPLDETAGSSYYDDGESRKYADLLARELKATLKNHAAFAAARQKRGIIEEEPEEAAAPQARSTTYSKQVQVSDVPPAPPLPPADWLASIPAFPLPVAVPDPLPNCNNFHAQKLIPPPPPPPPLRPMNFGPYGDNAGSPYTVDDFLEAIKTASAARQENEEVFSFSDDGQ